jgi:addiction module RelE/StbE family toxin
VGRGRKIVWAPSALRDLKEIFEYISLDNPRAAVSWLKDVIRQVEKSARFPETGRMIPELDQVRYRELLVGDYRIFHEIEKQGVKIFGIFHIRRLFPI